MTKNQTYKFKTRVSKNTYVIGKKVDGGYTIVDRCSGDYENMRDKWISESTKTSDIYYLMKEEENDKMSGMLFIVNGEMYRP